MHSIREHSFLKSDYIMWKTMNLGPMEYQPVVLSTEPSLMFYCIFWANFQEIIINIDKDHIFSHWQTFGHLDELEEYLSSNSYRSYFMVNITESVYHLSLSFLLPQQPCLPPFSFSFTCFTATVFHFFFRENLQNCLKDSAVMY